MTAVVKRLVPLVVDPQCIERTVGDAAVICSFGFLAAIALGLVR